jgi:hypothetical protein
MVYRISEVGKHLLKESFFGHGRVVCRLAAAGDHPFGLLDGFVFAQVLFVHNKVDHVQAFAVGLAARGKAVTGLRFIVHLHARGFIVMERAMQSEVFIRFQAVVVQYLGQTKLLFDFGDLHTCGLEKRFDLFIKCQN